MLRKVLLSLLLVGCNRPTPVQVVLVEASVPPQPSAPVPALDAFAVATFTNDVLDECDEFIVPAEQASAWKAAIGKDGTVLASCDGFKDRPIFATCAGVALGDSGLATGTIRYYRFARVGHDDHMLRECLSLKGQWSAMPRDSFEYHHAETKEHLDKLNR